LGIENKNEQRSGDERNQFDEPLEFHISSSEEDSSQKTYLFEYAGSHTFGRAEVPRGLPRRDGDRIARHDEGSTRRAPDHIRTRHRPAADLFAQVLKILDRPAQTIGEARYRLNDVDDEGECQKDQNAAKDKVQGLPPGL
jgi:hypothetical protein